MLPLNILGPITEELAKVFKDHSGSKGVLTREQTRTALNEILIFPSLSQVTELVYYACECAGRTPVDHITFGEFCLLVTELRQHYQNNPHAPHPLSQRHSRVLQVMEEKRRKRRLHGSQEFFGEAGNFKVFLGGSCNPTTWRKDIAIPYLIAQDITFYNPQVSCWKPELMELEDQAKQSAELLFFVIDNQTRSTASMVEAAYLAGCGRQLVLIVREFIAPVIIYGETLSDGEVEDLERSHAFLIDLVERQTIPVFDNIQTALKCTAKCVHQNLHVSQLEVSDGVKPVKYPHIRVADKLVKLKDAFHVLDANNSGKLSYKELQLAFRTVTNEELLAPVLQKDDFYTFEDFCLINAEFKYKRKTWWEYLSSMLFRWPLRLFHWFHTVGGGAQASVQYNEQQDTTRKRDVFLGGTCGQSTWREDLAIPILRKNGLSYYNPQLQDWSTRYIPLEAAVKDNCRLLLYVITDDTRGVSSMLEVAHYIGQGCNIVLCIQNIPRDSKIENEALTLNAVKDYNRARAYLSDLANRDGIPVFEDSAEAIQCAVDKLKK